MNRKEDIINIFVLDYDFSKCAEYHVDKHVVKMILEATQLLSSAYYSVGNNGPYKLTHKNHPCSKFTCYSIQNWIWVSEYGKALCKEYTYRYSKIHKCEAIIDKMIKYPPKLPDIGLTNFALAMPEKYKTKDDVVKSYRNYYINEKRNIGTWKKRNVPEWWK